MRFAFFAGRAMVRVLRSFFSGCVVSAPCVLCGGPAGSISLCNECRRLLDEEADKALQDYKRCVHCGRPLLSEHGVCTSCRENPLFQNVDGVFPLFPYVLSKKKLLYGWKIGRQHNLTEIFAAYLAKVIKTHYPDAVVVPVPPRPGKIKKSGWDQIEDISLYLEHIHHIRVVRLLRRTETMQQKKLSREERSEHSKRSYMLDEKVSGCMGKTLPEHVVLVDDVITTGNTVRACANVLKETDFIKKVSAAALFIVPG
ncbi:MAG: ComF family protein [Treponema sp.]|nr:ComF family protein [Candidatus Treponema caballi]